MSLAPGHRTALLAVSVFALDQLTKHLVMAFLSHMDEAVVVDGFFKLVHWGNTGAAWSLFADQNALLAVVSLAAMLALFLWRHHFDPETATGWTALGLLFGGIAGNVADRLIYHHVVDFVRFYLYSRTGMEIGFPAFNVADSAICIGVGLLFLQSWRKEKQARRENAAFASTDTPE